jgi:hypothetical protein
MTNHDDFATLDLSSLSSVTGGAGGANEDDVNIGVDIPGYGRGGVQGRRTRTNWGHCADIVKELGGTPADVRSTCGLPPG